MKIVAVYIESYKGIEKSFIPISDSFEVEKHESGEINLSKKSRFDRYYSGFEISLLLGPNGSGKTTIFEFIQGVFDGFYGEGFCIIYNQGQYEVYSNITETPKITTEPKKQVKVYHDSCQYGLAVVNNIFDAASFSFESRAKPTDNLIIKTDTFISRKGKQKSFLENVKTQMTFFDEDREFLESINNPNPQYLFTFYKPTKSRFLSSIEQCSEPQLEALSHEISIFYSNLAKNRLGSKVLEERERIDSTTVDFTGIIKAHLRNAASYIFSSFHYKNFDTNNELVWRIQQFFLNDVLWKISAKYFNKDIASYVYLAFMLVGFEDLGLFQFDNEDNYDYIPELLKEEYKELNFYYEDIQISTAPMLNIALDIEEQNIPVQNSDSGIHFSSNKIEYIDRMTRASQALNRDYLVRKIIHGWTGFSSGELAQIKLFSRIYQASKELKSSHIDKVIFLIDEVDLYLHPEWQREFLNRLLIFASKLFRNKNVHFILSTHSPIIASDFLAGDITMVFKNKSIVSSSKSNLGFGCGINKLFLNSFSLKSSVGVYSRNYLNDLLKKAKTGKFDSFDLMLIDEICDSEIRRQLKARSKLDSY